MLLNKEYCIFWFRRDLRTDDNHGLFEALSSGLSVKPVFIFDREILDKLDNAQDRRVNFIHKTLHEIKQELKSKGGDLQVYYGKPDEIWAKLLTDEKLKAIYCNEDYEPYAIKRDADIKSLAEAKGIEFYSFKDQVIFAKNEVVKDDGKPYTVYTPYSRKWKGLFRPQLCEAYNSTMLNNLLKFEAEPLPTLQSMRFDEMDAAYPQPQIADTLIEHYGETRDFPAMRGTSRLGLHLRFGTVSLRRLVNQSLTKPDKFLNELIWREFYQQILWHFPHVTKQSFKPKYDLIEWRNNPDEFDRWCQGKTGYPIVDAGMRELLATGYMHNRVRMIVASFLTKHLLIDWRWGEAWFARHLLDFDLASNNGGWQWAAGSGVDAAPYFRVFNPTLQTLKFDGKFEYIRKWVPEFDSLHYTKPMVEHELARKRCLEVYQKAVGPSAGE
jgi:deoxyribodipyrimidine photo-lyase